MQKRGHSKEGLQYKYNLRYLFELHSMEIGRLELNKLLWVSTGIPKATHYDHMRIEKGSTRSISTDYLLKYASFYEVSPLFILNYGFEIIPLSQLVGK